MQKGIGIESQTDLQKENLLSSPKARHDFGVSLLEMKVVIGMAILMEILKLRLEMY